MSDRDSDFGAFLAGFVIGGLVGAATALLLAPQSGEQTRTVIHDKSIELKDKAVVAAEEARAKAEAAAAEARARADELAKMAKERADDLKKRGQEVIESGKTAIQRKGKVEKVEPPAEPAAEA
ncbi:MAG: YtxH domain-containing protein [Anaerolineales bacterium]|nr:YtxH domain-containing protein [Anaerolineales bacterium]